MSYALNFFSELSDEKERKQFGKRFESIMTEMRKMPLNAYKDPKVMKWALESFELISSSMRDERERKNKLQRLSTRLAKIKDRRKKASILDSLKEDEKEEGGDAKDDKKEGDTKDEKKEEGGGDTKDEKKKEDVNDKKEEGEAKDEKEKPAEDEKMPDADAGKKEEAPAKPSPYANLF